MKQEFQICTVVHGESLETFVKNLKKAQRSATMVELRADSIKDFNLDDMPILMGLLKVPCIFTFRHKTEGGLYKGTKAKQKEILKGAFKLGVDYVDVAYDNRLVNELSAKEKKKLLLSYHCDECTPDFFELIDILDAMRSKEPAIIKIVTLVEQADDLPILSALLMKRKKDEKLIVIGMGKLGQITRLTFPALGSYIAFVTMKGEKNIAPGMLTEEDLKPIIDYFNK